MASRPLKTKTGHYYIVWTDRKRTPIQTSESLMTKKLTQARAKKAELEDLYYRGKHDPWQRKWHEARRKETDSYDPVVLAELYIKDRQTGRGIHNWTSRKTVQSKACTVRAFAKHVGVPSVDMITEEHIKDFIYRPSMSESGIRSYAIVIKSFMNWMVEQGYISSRPEIRVPRPPEKIPPYIDPEQLLMICEHHKGKVRRQIRMGASFNDSNGLWMADMWLFMARTGLRPVEAFRLKVGDVSEDEILVGSWYQTKTKAQRKVPVFEQVKPIIRKYTSPIFRKRDKHLVRSDLLFGRKSESSQRRCTIAFVEAVRETCPEHYNVRLYDLRHSFAVWYLSQPGLSAMDFRMTKLMYMMGHKNITTTQIYLKSIASLGLFDDPI